MICYLYRTGTSLAKDLVCPAILNHVLTKNLPAQISVYSSHMITILTPISGLASSVTPLVFILVSKKIADLAFFWIFNKNINDPLSNFEFTLKHILNGSITVITGVVMGAVVAAMTETAFLPCLISGASVAFLVWTSIKVVDIFFKILDKYSKEFCKKNFVIYEEDLKGVLEKNIEIPALKLKTKIFFNNSEYDVSFDQFNLKNYLLYTNSKKSITFNDKHISLQEYDEENKINLIDLYGRVTSEKNELELGRRIEECRMVVDEIEEYLEYSLILMSEYEDGEPIPKRFLTLDSYLDSKDTETLRIRLEKKKNEVNEIIDILNYFSEKIEKFLNIIEYMDLENN